MADAGNDEFLGAHLYQRMSIGVFCAYLAGWEKSYIGLGYIGGRPDPFDCVANLLNGVDERTDVAGDVVEEVNCRHIGWMW